MLYQFCKSDKQIILNQFKYCSVQRTKEKVNFTAEDHQQITYEERTVYQFDELLSYESLDGKATVANAELMVKG